MHAELTDDIGLSPEFADGYSDYDPMYADAPGDAPKCGRGPYSDIPCCCDDEGKYVGPGCRYCNPPDHENKPYGFGIETFEHNPSLRLANELCLNGPVAFGWMSRPSALTFARLWTGFSYRRLRHSDRVWDQLCDDCETHEEAKAKYETWAKRSATVRYRDERP